MDLTQGIILFFTKYPRAGQSKTRLIPCLGPDGAASLQHIIATATCKQLHEFCGGHNCSMEIIYTGGTKLEMSQWLGDYHIYHEQKGDDLGTRMALAIEPHLRNSRNIILCGSDCPSISGSLLSRALSALDHHDVVIGPAHDGGYYLIGVRQDFTQRQLNHLFSDIDWSTSLVLSQTLDRISALQLSLFLLQQHHDIDTPDDLRHIHYYPHAE